jgi:uncharacterized protein YcnI
MTSRKPAAVVVLMGLIAAVIVAAPVFAHAVVFPREVRPGAYEKFVLRVPNERDVATTRVELTVPDAVRVVSFGDVPGWQLEVVSDAEGRVTGAVWTGALPVQRFVEFPFVAATPDEEMRLRWNAVQTYANGERVAWAGPEDSATPASFTLVRAAGVSGPGVPALLSGVAIVLALLALGLALRGGRPHENVDNR